MSADAKDAYFFTRDTLVEGDYNGSRIKVYDAREGGGFPYVPPAVPCKASDECHGPGTLEAPPPAVGSVAGTPIGNLTATEVKTNCNDLAHLAKKNSSRAKALRREAQQVSGKPAKLLRRKASKSAKQARKLSKKAKACRSSSGGNE